MVAQAVEAEEVGIRRTPLIENSDAVTRAAPSRTATLFDGRSLTQLARQREEHFLLAPDHFLRHFRTPATQPLHNLLHQQLRS